MLESVQPLPLTMLVFSMRGSLAFASLDYSQMCFDSLQPPAGIQRGLHCVLGNVDEAYVKHADLGLHVASCRREPEVITQRVSQQNHPWQSLFTFGKR